MQILILDNEPSLRKALRMGMSAEGWVITATGMDMLDRDTNMAGHGYDVLIVDLDTDKPEYLETVREMNRQNPNLIVIGMTRGRVMELFSDEDMDFVSVCYRKPLHLNMLKKAINLEVKKLALTGNRSIL